MTETHNPYEFIYDPEADEEGLHIEEMLHEKEVRQQQLSANFQQIVETMDMLEEFKEAFSSAKRMKKRKQIKNLCIKCLNMQDLLHEKSKLLREFIADLDKEILARRN